MCGQRTADGHSFADARLKVGIAFSPFAPARDPERAYADMRVPVFYWTGTEDRTPAGISIVTPIQHRIPFDDTVGRDAYLVVLTGGDHNLYLRHPGQQRHDADWLDLIGRGTVAFLDKYLKADAAQAAFLDGDRYAEAVRPLGTLDRKRGR